MRLVRYLAGRRWVSYLYRWQRDDEARLKIFADTDYAGCRSTRKSTSGGIVMIGDHCVKFWSKTQQNITISTAEAELVALVKGGCEGIGIMSLMDDLGMKGAGNF